MIPRLKDAIVSLVGNTTAFEITDGAITNWDYSEVQTNVAQPTAEALATELTRLQGVYDALEYSRLRKAKYDLLNQDEMRYDDMVNNSTTWRDGIAAIKTAHPKP
jgi:hypothetical protein